MYRKISVTATASIVTILLGAVNNKIIAFFGGPSGLALFGQLRQVIQLSTIIATVSGDVSIIRGVASAKEEEKIVFIKAVLPIYIFGFFIVSSVVIFASPKIASFVFISNDKFYADLIRIVPIAVIFSSLSSLFISIINGYRAIRNLAAIQIIGALVTTVCCYPIVIWENQYKYFLLIVIGFITTSLFGAIATFKYMDYSKLWLTGGKKLLDKMKDHLSFSMVLLITGASGSAMLIIIRAIHINKGGMDFGGNFEAAWLLSNAYIMILLSSFGTYYMPTLSVRKNKYDIEKLVNQILRFSAISATALISAVIIFKGAIIQILFSYEFNSAVKIVRLMLIGDYFKVSGWVFGMLLLSFADRRNHLIFEISSHLFLIVGTYTLIKYMTDAFGYVFLTFNVLYLLFIRVYSIKKFNLRIEKRIVKTWIIGIAIILFFSLITWNTSDIKMLHLLIWLLSISVFMFISLDSNERIYIKEGLKKISGK